MLNRRLEELAKGYESMAEIAGYNRGYDTDDMTDYLRIGVDAKSRQSPLCQRDAD